MAKLRPQGIFLDAKQSQVSVWFRHPLYTRN